VTATRSEKTLDQIDTDDDGYITADELKESLKGNPKISDENVATVAQMADEDGDQKITYDEYAKFVR